MNSIPKLTADQIEVKVKKVTERGVIALLYKTARVDMEILDQVYGPTNWQCSYREIKGNLYCTIAVWDAEKNQWISKEDCGIESREDEEGNQKKGEASDAFKRAGFKWGIGRDLYTAPFVFINAENAPVENKNGKFQLKNPFTDFSVKQIGYGDNGEINLLTISDGKKLVFVYGQAKANGSKPEPKTTTEPPPDDDGDQIISKDELKEMLQQLQGLDGKISKEDEELLITTYKSFGYKKAAEIKRKDYQAIMDKVTGHLPFDL